MQDDRERLLSRGAVAAGAPLATALVLPYPLDRGWAASWELAETFDEQAFVVAPAMGVVMLLAIGLPRLPYALRAGLVMAAGVVAALSLRALALHPEVIREASRDVRTLSLAAVDGLVAAVLLACALEVAMQRRRGSRWWAIAALLGWLHLMARWVVPLASDRTESMPLIATAEAVTELDRTPGLVLVIVPALLYLLLPGLQALLALIRLLSSAEKRADRPWRSAWVAVLLVVLPGVLVSLALAVVALAEQEAAILAVAFNGGALVVGSTLGAVWGIGSFLPVVGESLGRLWRGLRSDRREHRRGAQLVAGVLVALLVLLAGRQVWRATRPDPRDAALASLVEVTQEAIVAATMGEPYDPRWHGGYSAFDIRASAGALREVVGEGAVVEPVLFAFDLDGHGGVPFRGRVVVIDDEVYWSRLDRGWPDGELSVLEPIPALEAAVERAGEALGGGECVEPLVESDLEGLPPAALQLVRSGTAVQRACEEGSVESDRLESARPDTRGRLGDYLMLVRSGPRWLVLRGRWHADSRLWLGRVEVTPL